MRIEYHYISILVVYHDTKTLSITITHASTRSRVEKKTPRVLVDQSKRGNFPATRARRLEARGGGDSMGRRDAPTAHVDATIEGGLDDARDRIV